MKKKIYIADNDELVNYFSDNENFELVGNSIDGEVIVKEVEEKKPDILVMEIMLTKLDGFAVYEKIKEMKEDTPKVIFVSNLSHSGFVSKAIQMGASYFMIKPITPENLESNP